MNDTVKLIALDKALQFFERTVRTSDPNEVVRYAQVFEDYLRGGLNVKDDEYYNDSLFEKG